MFTCHAWFYLLTKMLYYLINSEPMSLSLVVLMEVLPVDLLGIWHARGENRT
jgi:hypothetical protein